MLLALPALASAQTAGENGPVELGDIVVTATKQASAVSTIPIAINVITKDDLDQQSIRTQEDLSRISPSLVITNGNSSAGSNVYLRGIASNVGAPTVGIYLDDVPLQRRNQSSSFNGNGTSFPQFFDLERVEVLKGPQGTLYGGSSIGGTVRFVLPEPDLKTMKVRTKLEGAFTEHGDPSIEGGAMISVPLIEDQLGLLTSVYARRLGGWVDHVSVHDGRVLDDNTNSQDSYSGRIALLWRPNDTLTVKPAVYYSNDTYNDSDKYWTNIPSYTIPGYTVAGSATTNGQPYVVPAYTFPERNFFGPYKTGSNCVVGDNFKTTQQECAPREKRESKLLIPSLTVSADMDWATLTSVTSYTFDRNQGVKNNGYEDLVLIGTGRPAGGIPNALPSGNIFSPLIRNYSDPFSFDNQRKGWTQELRVATDNSKMFSFVGGLYYSRFVTSSYGQWEGNTEQLLKDLYNVTVLSRYLIDTIPLNYRRNQQVEKELAAFGELTFSVTDKLKLLAGARISKTKFSYYEETAGSTVGRATATTTNGGITNGTIKESPFTPKFGAQYFIDNRNMIYASASKGFRPGGVSSRPIGTICDAELAALNFPNVPAVPFKSDSVWAYEAGAKLRPFGNVLSLEASAYRIDWKDTQVTYRLNCNGTYVANAGKARSEGVELQASLRPTAWLTLNGALSYVDATYGALSLGSVKFINEGDPAPVPKWSYNLGAQVRAPISSGAEGYARFDFQHSGGYPTMPGPGTNGHFPDVYKLPSTNYASMRLGVETGKLDISFYVNNLFASKDITAQTLNRGRGNCSFNSSGGVTACTRDSHVLWPYTFRPRTLGVTAKFTY
ncbi:TonB-dependent receptor [Sphingobium subterraneum]|uniref:Outer membrane receptor protein involved in Fe transport n=1 Tax=Sphingobium subterraneum TaxID=627688 RepID=A0A841J4C4_9SPHN|nr:TonB-dependent receptor [Sphingobium subterraneum]MBB6123435.1 outer membrane receptor protein involved in Fe transport [Sphingobium subterraneum]